MRKASAPREVAALTTVRLLSSPVPGTTCAASADTPKAMHPMRLTETIPPSTVRGGRRSRPWTTST